MSSPKPLHGKTDLRMLGSMSLGFVTEVAMLEHWPGILRLWRFHVWSLPALSQFQTILSKKSQSHFRVTQLDRGHMHSIELQVNYLRS